MSGRQTPLEIATMNEMARIEGWHRTGPIPPPSPQMQIRVDLYGAGVEAGKKWSRRLSLDDRLDALDRIQSEDLDFLDVESAFTPAERLYFILADIGEHDRDRADAGEFWESVCDDSQPEVDYLDGFALGIVVA
jgi:hypothetical protein